MDKIIQILDPRPPSMMINEPSSEDSSGEPFMGFSQPNSPQLAGAGPSGNVTSSANVNAAAMTTDDGTEGMFHPTPTTGALRPNPNSHAGEHPINGGTPDTSSDDITNSYSGDHTRTLVVSLCRIF